VGLGVSPLAHLARLKVLTDVLEHLDRRGLTAAIVIANFHWQRVIPLVERVLPIFKLTPGAQASGSRTSVELLPRDIAARWAWSAVAEFPNDPEDLWRIKKRPEPGYISLVSFDSGFVVDMCCSFPRLLTSTWLCFAGVEVPPLEASGPGRTPNQPPARRGGEEVERRGRGDGREEEEEESDAQQGVQDRSRGGEAAACHARVHIRGGGGGLG